MLNKYKTNTENDIGFNVGDWVYIIKHKENKTQKYIIEEKQILDINILENDIIFCVSNGKNKYPDSYMLQDIGTSIFFKKEHAENKLKWMKKECFN